MGKTDAFNEHTKNFFPGVGQAGLCSLTENKFLRNEAYNYIPESWRQHRKLTCFQLRLMMDYICKMWWFFWTPLCHHPPPQCLYNWARNLILAVKAFSNTSPVTFFSALQSSCQPGPSSLASTPLFRPMLPHSSSPLVKLVMDTSFSSFAVWSTLYYFGVPLLPRLSSWVPGAEPIFDSRTGHVI